MSSQNDYSQQTCVFVTQNGLPQKKGCKEQRKKYATLENRTHRLEC